MDDSFIFDEIDDTLLNTDLDILKQARENMIRNGEDTSIIENAINRKIEIDRKEKEEEKQYKELCKDAAFLGLVGGLISDKSSKTNYNNDYEPYQYEEEELEDDDYYNEDMD